MIIATEGAIRLFGKHQDQELFYVRWQAARLWLVDPGAQLPHRRCHFVRRCQLSVKMVTPFMAQHKVGFRHAPEPQRIGNLPHNGPQGSIFHQNPTVFRPSRLAGDLEDFAQVGRPHLSLELWMSGDIRGRAPDLASAPGHP